MASCPLPWPSASSNRRGRSNALLVHPELAPKAAPLPMAVAELRPSPFASVAKLCPGHGVLLQRMDKMPGRRQAKPSQECLKPSRRRCGRLLREPGTTPRRDPSDALGLHASSIRSGSPQEQLCGRSSWNWRLSFRRGGLGCFRPSSVQDGWEIPARTLLAFRLSVPFFLLCHLRFEEGGRMAPDGHLPEPGKQEVATTAAGAGLNDLVDPQFMCCVCL
ncbi:hypothetical protein HU200_007468 [Digitaria exilis]|uniref:Uncharacterized protein n=1 Tax=Digitaria exilis TaxID=1010633 RepID=A0A835KRF8_9POAL|nr:hypothetical protein HU200_007468 [Digitaria exilis]